MKDGQKSILIDLETVENKRSALKIEIKRVWEERYHAKQLLQDLGISASRRSGFTNSK